MFVCECEGDDKWDVDFGLGEEDVGAVDRLLLSVVNAFIPVFFGFVSSGMMILSPSDV